MKYQYMAVSVKVSFFGDSDKKQTAQLNAYGAQGWKLVTTLSSKKYMKYLFMKEAN